ncbi:MAG: RNA polymerase sigma factor [Ilumatobacter sp.]|nr:RNA polymerase sigma factor [Ilumatobacter sp.]MCB0985671.1 RNA polymerase sigma factor [Ilumatobacter sp.]
MSALLQLYDEALPHVYGYLVRRCDTAAVAEDLTAETFMAAVVAHRGGTEIGVPWLIGTARHKLVDHWRRAGRQREAMAELWELAEPVDDTGDPVEALHVRDVLARLTPLHRLALTLRYLDGLPVDEVAGHLDRSLHATESVLARARAAYRQAAHDLEGGER